MQINNNNTQHEQQRQRKHRILQLNIPVVVLRSLNVQEGGRKVKGGGVKKGKDWIRGRGV